MSTTGLLRPATVIRRNTMSEQKTKGPAQHYQDLAASFPEVLAAVENLGETVRSAGPVDQKTSELIQLAAAAATGSTGSVRSHTRKALQAGASRQEIQHTLLLLISTIGFPQVAAALFWVKEILGDA